MYFILICVGMFHIFLNIFDIFTYMFDMLDDISICLLTCVYIYIYDIGWLILSQLVGTLYDIHIHIIYIYIYMIYTFVHRYACGA